MSRDARVRAVVAAARALVEGEGAGALRRELQVCSGLSSQGVELVLTRHLELEPSDDALALLVQRAVRTSPPSSCHVLLSSNVCTGALRAIALAAAVAPAVFVRPSSRDPALAEALCAALATSGTFAQAGGLVRCVDRLSPSPGDEVHAYGSDDTLARLSFAPGVRVLRFGSGFGLALPAGLELAAEAAALADDVIAFDQRGCLSPRLALVPASRSESFGAALALALATAEQRTPRGPLAADEVAELARYRRAALALGHVLEGEGYMVGVSEVPDALVLPPAARIVHVVPCDGFGPNASSWLARATAIGGAGPLFEAARRLAPRARATALGLMQRPPLDGPVDLRGPV